MSVLVYLYLGGSFAILVDRMGWFNLAPFQQDKGALFFIRLISWPILLASLPLIISYERHGKNEGEV